MAASSSTSSLPFGILNLDHIDCRPETKNMLAEINKVIATINRLSTPHCSLTHTKIFGKNFFFFGENHIACQDLTSRLFKGAKERTWRIFTEGASTHPPIHAEFLKNWGIPEGYCFGLEPGLYKLFHALVQCTLSLHSQEKHGLATPFDDLTYLLKTITQEFITCLAYPDCSEALKKFSTYPDFVKLLSTPLGSLKEFPVTCYQFLALEILNLLPVHPDVFKRYHSALSALDTTSMRFMVDEINLIREMNMGGCLLETLSSLETVPMPPEYAQIDTFVITGAIHSFKIMRFLEVIFFQISFSRLLPPPSSSSSASPPAASSSSTSSSSFSASSSTSSPPGS